jgi:transposase
MAAVTIVSEVGAMSRFENARQVMGFSGLVPSEFSSGKTIRRGRINKTGNAHLRRVVVESFRAAKAEVTAQYCYSVEANRAMYCIQRRMKPGSLH